MDALMQLADASGRPRALIIAGPNGAGKTTFAREFLVAEGDCLAFVNADLIAAGLSPFDVDAAGVQASRLLVRQIRDHVAAGRDFAVETTLAGRAYLRHIRAWHAAGYQVKIVFLRLPSADLAVERVMRRVQQGGHDIPEDVIRRRFARGDANFETLFRKRVEFWQVYDAAGYPPVLVAEGENR